MADLSRISTPFVAPSTQGGGRASASSSGPLSAPSSAPMGYSFAEEVSRRANVISDQESPRNQASLQRLDRALNSGQALRGDVPRGFYLDLQI
ncbi:MAG: hypothetical protein NUV50_08155 [Rhodospirillales bacterium]|nr:hypothetical protein [Rhodospirillales bacterium]